MRSPVGISNDVTMARTTHDAVVSGPGTPTTEAITTLFWGPGMLTGANKLTWNVFHQGLPIAQQQHDCGTMIVHQHAIPDPMDLLATVASSRSAIFSASTVRAQGKELAACGITSAPTFMLACAQPVPLPQPGAITLAKNTASFGLTPFDLVAGFAEMIAQIAIDGIGAAVGGKKGALWGWVASMAAKNAWRLGVAAYKAMTTDGEVEVNFEIDAPYIGRVVQGTWGAKRDAAGNWSWASGTKLGPLSGESSERWGEDGLEKSWKIDLRTVDMDGNVSVPIGDDPDLVVKPRKRSIELDKRPQKRVVYEYHPEDPRRHGRVRIEEDDS